jgi:hypothetical protein
MTKEYKKPNLNKVILDTYQSGYTKGYEEGFKVIRDFINTSKKSGTLLTVKVIANSVDTYLEDVEKRRRS